MARILGDTRSAYFAGSGRQRGWIAGPACRGARGQFGGSHCNCEERFSELHRDAGRLVKSWLKA